MKLKIFILQRDFFRKADVRLVGLFLWIILGAILLWFFTLNLGQTVDINFFGRIFEKVSLVQLIFIILFIGILLGALLFVSLIFKIKVKNSRLRKANSELVKEIEGWRKISAGQEPSDSNSKFGAEN